MANETDPLPDRAGTLRDVARMANVSVSTASRALSGSGLVSADTEQRILKAAAALHYRPNTLARGLKTQSSRLIGLVLHNLAATSYRLLVETAQQRLGEAGYQVVLCITGDDAEREAAFLSAMENYRVEGIVIVPTGHNGTLLARLQKSGFPIVAAIRSQQDVELETILQADAEGAYEGTKYLLGLGHRRIGLIVGRGDTTSGGERLSGYLRGLREIGITVDESLIVTGPYTPETGVQGCIQLMSRKDRPTALFVANHEAAMGVLQYLWDSDVRIPEELSLLCYEDMPWYRWQKPAISVVDNGAQTIADLTVDGLMRQLNGAEGNMAAASAPRTLRVGARLIIRNSCCPPP